MIDRYAPVAATRLASDIDQSSRRPASASQAHQAPPAPKPRLSGRTTASSRARSAKTVSLTAEVVSVSDSQRLAYSIREAALCLGVHPLTVRAAISRGELRTIRLGRRILIPRAAVDELLNGERPDVRVAR